MTLCNMRASVVPHLPASGMLQCCSGSGRAGLQQLLRHAYRHSSRSRPSPVALALGPMSQSSPADFFQSMDKEMARMQQSFQQMEEQATRLREQETRLLCLALSSVRSVADNRNCAGDSRDSGDRQESQCDAERYAHTPLHHLLSSDS